MEAIAPAPALPRALPPVDEPEPSRRHGWWWKGLLVGVALWAISVGATIATRNTNLVPTLILLGSFLVPFTVVLFAIERVSRSASANTLLIAFFVGGVLGVVGASLLEVRLSQNLLTYFAVGFIEEFVKGAVLVVMGLHLAPKTARQGALLGAVVGAGFAAFESAGYAFNAALGQQGIDLLSLLQTEALRAVLTPLGHVLWTAVLGAAVFGASRDGVHYRLSLLPVVVYVIVSVLHGFWDSMGGLSSIIALVLTGNVVPALQYGVLRPGTAADVREISLGFYVLGLGIVSVLGGLALLVVLRRHRTRDHAVRTEQPALAVPLPASA